MKALPVILLILITITASLFPQEIIITNYNNKIGSGFNSYYDVFRDKDGILWVSSGNKIIKYNGITSRLVYEDTTSADNGYIKLKQDNSGNVWALPAQMDRSILLITKTGIKKFPPMLSISNSRMELLSFEILIEGKDTVIYAGTNSAGLVKYHKGNWQRVWENGFDKEQPVNILKYHNNKLYAGNSSALFSIADDKITEIKNLPEGEPLSVLFEDKNSDSFWILTNKSLGFYDGKDTRTYNISLDLVPSDYQTRNSFRFNPGSIIKKNDFLIFGSQTGLYIYNIEKNKLRYLDQSTGLSGRGVTGIFADKENNIWVTTPRGIDKLRFSPFENYNSRTGLLSDEVSALEFFNDGTPVIGHNEGITIMKKNGFKKIRLESFSPVENPRILFMSKDKNDNIWFVSGTWGLGKINRDFSIDKAWQNDSDRVVSLMVDDEETVWLGTVKGFFRKPVNSTTFSKVFSTTDYLRNVVKTADGSIVICTNEGLIFYKNGKTRRIKASDNMGNKVYAFFENYKGYRLAGTSNGLYYVDDDKLVKVTSGSLAVDYPVYFLAADSINLWVGLSSGVMKINNFSTVLFNKPAGLSGYETNRGTGKFDKNGNFWIGTTEGLSIYHNNWENNVYTPPVLTISSLEIPGNDEVNTFRNPVSIESGEFTVNYNSTSFINEEKNYFTLSLYRGDEKNAEAKTNLNSYTFKELAPGEYNLKIFMVNALDQKSNIAEVNLIVESGNMALVTVLSGIALLLVMGYLIIKRKEINKNEEITVSGEKNEKTGGYYNPEKELISKLNNLMEEEHLYRNPDLTVELLSSRLKVKSRNLSNLIKEEYNQNFSSYINSYRIKDAKEKLLSREFDHYSIEGISKSVGFKSKSAFNRAFKEITGSTPSEAKKLHQSYT